MRPTRKKDVPASRPPSQSEAQEVRHVEDQARQGGGTHRKT